MAKKRAVATQETALFSIEQYSQGIGDIEQSLCKDSYWDEEILDSGVDKDFQVSDKLRFTKGDKLRFTKGEHIFSKQLQRNGDITRISHKRKKSFIKSKTKEVYLIHK
jgi:hypothetical protein